MKDISPSISLTEAAKRLGMSRTVIYQEVKRGRLRAFTNVDDDGKTYPYRVTLREVALYREMRPLFDKEDEAGRHLRLADKHRKAAQAAYEAAHFALVRAMSDRLTAQGTLKDGPVQRS